MTRFTQFQFGTQSSSVSNINEIIGGDRTILDTTLDLFIDADSGNDTSDGSSVGQAFQSVTRLKEELESYYLKGGILRTNWVGNNTSLYDPLVITGEDLLGFGTLEFTNVTATESINFTTGVGNKIDIDGSNLSNQLAIEFDGFEPDFDIGSFNIENVDNFTINNSSDVTADSATINNNLNVVLNSSTFNLPNGILIENLKNIQVDIVTFNDTFLRLTSVTDGTLGNISISNATNPAPILDIVRSSGLELINNFNYGTSLDLEPFTITDSSDIDIDFTYTGTNGVYAGTEPPIEIINSQRINFLTVPLPTFTLTGLTTRLQIDGTSTVNTFDDTFTFIPYDGANQIDGGAIIDEIDAAEILYDNTISGLTGTDVQAAIDELATAGATGAVVKLNAPGSTIGLDATGGNDTNDGFTTDIQTFSRLQELLQSYNWEDQTVTVNISNYTGGDTIGGSGIYGINNLTFNFTGNILTSSIGFSRFKNITNLTINNLTLDDAQLTVDSASRILILGLILQNFTSGDVVDLQDSDDASITITSITNSTIGSVVEANNIECLTVNVLSIVTSTFTEIVNIIDRCEKFVYSSVSPITGKKYTIEESNPNIYINDNSTSTETVTSTFPDNTSFDGSGDYDNTISGLTATTQKTGIDEVAFTRLSVNRNFGIIGTINLTNTDLTIQHLEQSTGSTITVNLPGSPVKDRFFSIKNSASSTVGSTFTIQPTNVVVAPDETYEVIYDAVEWVEL